MSNKFLLWTFSIFFFVAVTLTGIRVFIVQDYPVLTDDTSEESLGDENEEEVMTEDDALVRSIEEDAATLGDSDPVIDDAL